MNARTVDDAQQLTREQVADLLHRYPHVSPSETKLIIGFLRKGRQLDVGILTADEQLKPHLDSFMADHAAQFRVSLRETSAVTGAIAAFLGICWLIWEAVKPGTLPV
jgi:hypothetical protein